ncbi:hypothetical protein I6F65_09465 [Pseudoalteromonas sp. SWXJZ94C]|uniref:Ig-like domain-containing protein n=1 Tax=Pseudoalteromonas sp. SWXJZ94C TaxID=2792065 RepID=UPI0018CEA30B|nr:Ig-like domain-containing protein [Pseudoalteromonas sp. SWXJZ94C]MBH0057191.1 hypothetical protein [Pseudoalteromonas sp. SWXJZ94C]
MNRLIKFTPILCALALAGCGSGSGNSAPLFTQSNLSFTLNEDTAFSGQVSATDDDPLSYTLAQSPSNGIITLEANGEFTYTPHADFFGEDSTTISASDGSLSADVVVRFIIENINDEPTISTTNVTFTTSTTSVGKINTSDVDSDAVSITLLTPPSSGVISINSETGEFSYEAQTLTTQNDEFTVSYTDGIISEPLTATISLSPSYVTNEDKRNYYYSSDKSHLKQADLITENINDELSRYSIYQTQAAAYARAGFLTTAQEYLALINEQTAYADGLLKVASALDTINRSEQAIEYRELALTSYNQYLAEKGLDNIDRNDASWLLTITRDYLDALQLSQATSLIEQIEGYALNAAQDEFTTTFGYFITAFSSAASSTLESYAATPTAENLETAKLFAKSFAQLSNKTGYVIAKNGDYKGEPTHRSRILYLAWSAEFLLQTNQLELAREYTNKALALYGITNFDSNYNYAASPYSQATLSYYPYALSNLATLIEALYDTTQNPAYELITSEWEQSFAQRSMVSFIVAHRLLAGEDATTVLDEVAQPFKDKDEYNVLFQGLTDTTNLPGTALILSQFNRNDLAQQVMNYAGDLLISDEYIQAESYATYLTGFRGCSAFVEISGRVGMDEKVQAEKCITMLEKLQSGELQTLSSSSQISVHSNVIMTLTRSGSTDGIPAIYTQLLNHISELETPEDRFENRLETLGFMIDAGYSTQALDTFTLSVEEITPLISEFDSNQLIDLVELLKEYILDIEAPKTGYFTIYSALSSMGANAQNINDYEAKYQGFKAPTSTLINTLEERITALSDTALQSNMMDLVSAHVLLGDNAKAISLIENSVNGSADKLNLYTEMASLIAARDDFREKAVASVDTDHDGLPNFFLPNVSEDDITASGLIADQDADNDGIIDSEDSTPLGN